MAVSSIASILNPEHQYFLEDLYETYRKDPGSVAAEWRDFFQQMESQDGNGHSQGIPLESSSIPKLLKSDILRIPDTQLKALLLIQAYRRHGHYSANIDPLGLRETSREHLRLEDHNITSEELAKEVTVTFGGETITDTLGNLVEKLERIYCSSIGSEYFYIRSEERRRWLIERLESNRFQNPLENSVREMIYEKLFAAENFEKYIATHYPGKKRFSLEGGESLIPTLAAAVEMAGEDGIEQIVIGMAHRGRLNVLANILGKDPALIFAEFNENITEDIDSGDVKYHLGYSSDYETLSGKSVHLSLAFNPSHLEVINPVVLGSIRARQEKAGDVERRNHLPLIIHGDAAFAGQGINYECLNMSDLPAYKVGGALHIVCNNQIGFTTNPSDARSTTYATDLARMLHVPIFHVNGDDPEACFRAVRLAMEWRRKYQTDVFIDLICYRRLGHNETDEPAFTQPVMYKKIKSHPSTFQQYEKRLKEDGLDSNTLDGIKQKYQQSLDDAFKRVDTDELQSYIQTLTGNWRGFLKMDPYSRPDTSVPKETLEQITEQITSVPGDFQLNKKLQRLFQDRRSMIMEDKGVDWGMAEALAMGTLLKEGIPIRITGQDTKRGTFSHRHAVVFDSETDAEYAPLQHLAEDQGNLEIANSLLSEVAALGFEFGYSLADPKSLVIWEAQFGDFVNGAQVVIDQFIASSETKWNRYSGIVMLLPHGYEGQGPEHSSARLERFLQLCSQFNIQVANCTTPAQYFHLLRRQMHRNYRKPLVVMSPKSLLRHPRAKSHLADFTEESFQEVLDENDPSIDKGKVKALLFCSGKIYYDLLDQREKEEIKDIAIIRVEQLYPFPNEQIQTILKQYKQAKDITWVQEEPRNQGAWIYMENLLGHLCRQRLNYCGRAPSPSPATGYFKVHVKEQTSIVEEALQIKSEED
ncbi:MAG: 2-oxoglutarate dehydrogenase E1 component [Spirochaetaceae bacterium]|nr:2-oxoglutarate dehydrogenase E1 component [Spirochaetaceae bacterium]|tara:strand:- start:13035 stop:15815 length:2781 start_codon:yes stop_codon:yes gene_type:complete